MRPSSQRRHARTPSYPGAVLGVRLGDIVREESRDEIRGGLTMYSRPSMSFLLMTLHA